MSKGDRYENLSPKKDLNVIRPYLRDLINEHKPTVELSNNNNNNNNNNNKRAEWEIQLTMKTNCISTKNFKDKCTIFSKIELVEIFLIDFKKHKKNQMKEEANLFLIVLNYYVIIFKE